MNYSEYMDTNYEEMAENIVNELMEFLNKNANMTYSQLTYVAALIKSLQEIKLVQGDVQGRKMNEMTWEIYSDKYMTTAEEIAAQTESSYFMLEGGRGRLRRLIVAALRHFEEQIKAENQNQQV